MDNNFQDRSCCLRETSKQTLDGTAKLTLKN